jgi:hypothetical protein
VAPLYRLPPFNLPLFCPSFVLISFALHTSSPALHQHHRRRQLRPTVLYQYIISLVGTFTAGASAAPLRLHVCPQDPLREAQARQSRLGKTNPSTHRASQQLQNTAVDQKPTAATFTRSCSPLLSIDFRPSQLAPTFARNGCIERHPSDSTHFRV